MKALVYHGAKKVSVDNVPDAKIEDSKDVVLKVSSTAICGSDLHLFGGLVPTLEEGDILGHEFMGEVVEVGSDVKKLKKGDRVTIPFTIACGACFFCDMQMFSQCDNTNPNHEIAEKVLGYSPSGLFGFSHMYGGFSGGQAEYVRVPHADVGALKIPEHLSDDQVLFLTDIFPTGYMAAENCNIQKGDTVAIWGAGPVGQFAIRSAFMLGAGKVVSIDSVPERLAMAKAAGAAVINSKENTDVFNTLKDMTHGRGPDSVIDAVGMEAHGDGGLMGLADAYDTVKQTLKLESDKPTALRQAITVCRKGGTVSIPGVYGGIVDKFPLGVLFGKDLTIKAGQTHVQKYMNMLLEKIDKKEIDPSFVITHKVSLNEAPKMYETFRNKEDGCIKVVMKP